MHLRSNNVKLTFYNDAYEVVDELFKPLRSRYQENLETSMRGTNVQLMYFKWHKVNFRRGILIDRIKKKKVNINPKNKWEMFSICSNCCITL